MSSSSFVPASPSQKKDLSILGLQPDRFGRLPDSDSIKKAYRTRALLCHPDKNPNAVENNNAAFLELQGAYENLTSPLKLKEEKLKQQQQQQQQAAAQTNHPNGNSNNTFSSPSGGNSSGFGNGGYTYNVPKTSAFARTRTPPTSSRPAFCTKPPSKFGNSNSNNNNNFGASPKSFSSSLNNGSHVRSSTPTASSPSSSSTRRSSFMNSSSTPMSHNTNNNNSSSTASSSPSPSSSSSSSQIQNILPGTPLIPPPFPTPNNNNNKTARLSSSYSGMNNNIRTNSSHNNNNINTNIMSPFPAFLLDGKTYHFETDPSAFGIYSKHLRHGDTAKISVPVFQPELGEQVETVVTGIVIGVAADNNLYWWKIDEGGLLENVATYLAPKIPLTAYQQAHKVTVVKQQVPLMNPLNFSKSNSSCSSSNFATPSSSSSTPAATTGKNELSTIDEVVRKEAESRCRIVKIYDMWLGEAIWCFNLPTFSNADAVRFSRVVR